MKKDIFILLVNLFIFMMGTVTVLLIVAIIHLDINIVRSSMSEESLVEFMQEIFLLIIVVTYAWQAKKNKEMRPAFMLVTGFFACMFLREMDYWLGLIGFHWLPPVLLTAGLCICYSAMRLKKTIHGLALFSETKPFMLIMTGLLTILVFSRLFGMKLIWIALLGDDYSRWVKIFVEEGLELFGYALCLLGSSFYSLNDWYQKKLITRK